MGSLLCAWGDLTAQEGPTAESSLGSSLGNPSRDMEAEGGFTLSGCRCGGGGNCSAEAACVCGMLGCPPLRWRGRDRAQSPLVRGDTCFLFQAEIVKRLSAICAQIIPFLTQEVRGEAWDVRQTARASLEALRKG